MPIQEVQFGNVSISRLIIGGNPFSGFSHQTPEMDRKMRKYYTTDRIKRTLAEAEDLGINTHLGRVDHHVMRFLLEYWNEGGRIQWIAQTCPEVGSIMHCVGNAINGGAKACFIHGGVMDNLVAENRTAEIPEAIARIREAGMAAGVAGHTPRVFAWAEENIDVDFYMCCYYNPSNRDHRPQHVAGEDERFHDDDRDRMVATIANLSKPAIHYKVFAAGRKTPEDAFGFVAENLRPQDAVCIGIYSEDNPEMLREDVEIFSRSLLRKQMG